MAIDARDASITEAINLLNRATALLTLSLAPPAAPDGYVWGGPLGWVKGGFSVPVAPATEDPDPQIDPVTKARRWITPNMLLDMMPHQRQEFIAIDPAGEAKLRALVENPATANLKFRAPHFLK